MNEQVKLEYIRGLFLSPPVRVDYLTNISEKFKYVYVETPKVACSTVKKTLQYYEFGKKSESLANNVHDRSASPLIAPSKGSVHPEEYFVSNNYFRFAFVRNPFTRILSAYLDKIVKNEWERKRRLPSLGFDVNQEVSLADFLDRIGQQRPNEMDIHWCPQSRLMGFNRIKYDFVGRFENFEPDFQMVLAKVITDEATDEREILSSQKHGVQARSRIMEFMDENVVKRIVDIYREDFRNFLYSPDPTLA